MTLRVLKELPSGKLQPHPYADEFPLMDNRDFSTLHNSIQSRGLQFPIVLYQGKILDGRNRYKSCLQGDIKSKFQEFVGTDEEAAHFVIDANINRRHLEAGQKLSIVEKLLAPFRKEAKKAQQDAGGDKVSKTARALVTTSTQAVRAPNTREKLAKAAHVGIGAAQEFINVKEAAAQPDASEEIKALPAALRAGTISVHAAARKVKATKPKDVSVKDGTPSKAYAAAEAWRAHGAYIERLSDEQLAQSPVSRMLKEMQEYEARSGA